MTDGDQVNQAANAYSAGSSVKAGYNTMWQRLNSCQEAQKKGKLTVVSLEFVSDVLECPQGCVVACNMLDCIDLGMVDRSLVQGLWSRWYGAFIERASAYSRGVPRRRLQDELMFALDTALQTSIEPSACPGEDDVRLRFRVESEPLDRFSHTIRSELFLHHVIDSDDLRSLCGNGIVSARSGSGMPDYHWRSREPQTVAIRSDVTIGRPDSVVWLTPTAEIERGLSFEDAADRIRDHLGLIHHEAGRRLLAIHFDQSSLKIDKLARPTFADAGSHRRFKTVPDDSVNRGEATWGFAVDLSLLAENRQWVDGAPERVACPLKGSELGKVDIRYLGKLKTDHGKLSADDEKFAERLSERHRGCTEVRRRIEELLT